MARPPRPWFRFYTEAFNDRKLLRLSPTQRWIWVAILGAARESPQPGTLMVAEAMPMTRGEIARYADVKERDLASALDSMAALGMISEANGVVTVANWSTRQYESDDVTARTRDHRERSKEPRKAVPTNVPGNTPETEAETENRNTAPLEPKGSSRKAERDALFDAIAAVFGSATTKHRQGHYGKCVTELLEAGVSPADVRDRGKRLKARNWSNPSPEALLKWWDDLAPESPSAVPPAYREWIPGQA
ncbi:MAG: phage replisome organizer N-terminal domain-containing protein [Gemmatimonadaceae bacterium]|nr:phage replisome organizer N-terminal domain-containing protein [Gemmatimonadaceae bacterium]